jgi:hypothetical protein
MAAPIGDWMAGAATGLAALTFLVVGILPVDEDHSNVRLLTSAGLFVASGTFVVSSTVGHVRVRKCTKLVSDPSRP